MFTHEHKLTVVIPTLNEAKYLPILLNALKAQTRQANEIIVADAGSTDNTQAIAHQYGAKVIKGGYPAVGRNAGAAAASGDLILFLDADVLPNAYFLEDILTEFTQRELDTATCLVQAISDRTLDHFLHHITNLYLLATQRFIPHAPGFVILIRRELHETISGFDETLVLAEDQDYVYRAAQKGRFEVLQNVCLPVSVRRLESEGTIQLVAKYLWVEAHIMTRQPVHSIPFNYQFGKHNEARYKTNIAHVIPEPMLSFLQGQLPFDIFARAKKNVAVPIDILLEDEQE